ncbi:MAG: hypothetical protein PWQ31_587 [Eubacteriales bacterium]|nr:hypothetical protein [Eubacteriales bacterium]
MEDFFRGKTIVVTGGTGSIGAEIVRQLLKYNPKVVRVFSRGENKQFYMAQDFRNERRVRFFIGDVRDKERLERAFENADIIFHAAALKHVPACEYNPFEAVKTNIIGTQNVIDVAMQYNVERVIAISTDKAANPSNTMGTTKLMMEKLIQAANYYKGNRRTVFACVRFGNVIGSRGSEVPLFVQQVREGRKLQITHREMTRFFMTISQAVSLVFRAAARAVGGEVFILKMPALRIYDLARVIYENCNPCQDRNFAEAVEIIGVRPGEKLHEELMTEDESLRARDLGDMFVILPMILLDQNFDYSCYEDYPPAPVGSYSSQKTRLLNREEIAELLKEAGVL